MWVLGTDRKRKEAVVRWMEQNQKPKGVKIKKERTRKKFYHDFMMIKIMKRMGEGWKGAAKT